MSGSFLDTTVVVKIADRVEPEATAGKQFVRQYQPAQAPYYALRELLTGYVQILCDAHNALLAAQNPAEALLALHKRHPAEGRKKEAKLIALTSALDDIFSANPSGSREDLKREALQALALRANGTWRRAHKLPNVDLVHPLGCFNEGKITYGAANELRGPNNSFNCLKSERCAAAGYLYDNKNVLTKLIEALHPNNLPPEVANKNENRQRRKALKELQQKGPTKFNKGRCRALGDAYFAAMCPADSVVATTNTQDHLPLCAALAKTAIEPR